MKLKSVVTLLLIAVCLSLATLSVSAAETAYLPGDLNYDGLVNTTDVVYLRRFIAGGYGIDLTPPACQHNEVIDPAVAPTCTVTGLTEGKHCDKCGKVLVPQQSVPALGHNMVNGSCSVCGFGSNPELIETADMALTLMNEEMFDIRIGEGASDLFLKIADRIKNPEYVPDWRDVEDAFEEVYDSLEDALDELLTKPFDSAAEGKKAVWEQYAKSYLDAGNSFVELFKVSAKEVYLENYEETVDNLEEKYADITDESKLEAYRLKLALLKEHLDTFNANIDAIPKYTYEQLFDLELAKKYDPAYEKDYTLDDLKAYVSADGVKDNLTKYIVYLISGSINEHLLVSSDNGQSGMLAEAVLLLTEDLMQLRDRLDPTSEDADLYNESVRGSEIVYINGDGYKYGKFYSNTAQFEAMVDLIDEAITNIKNIRTVDHPDKEYQLMTPDSTRFGSNNRKKNLYWVNEQAKEWFEENGSDYVWLINLEMSEGKKITNANKDGDFITLNNTGIPVTVLRTAEQHAVLAAQTVYSNAFNDVHQMMIALDTTNYAALASKKITNTAEFKAILNNVKSNAELTAEIQAYAKVYTDKIATLAKDKKYGFTGNSFKSLAATNSYIDRPEHFTFNATELVNADNYNYELLLAHLYQYVDKFNQTFYLDDSRTACSIIELWSYKQYAVAFIADVINGYKNTYRTVVMDGMTVVEQIPGTLYLYDEGMTGPSVNGKAFEENLDALLESQTAKILSVQLNSRIDIKDYYGGKLNSRPGDFAWSMASAQRTVNAYIVDLLGYDEAREFSQGVNRIYSDTMYTAPNGVTYMSGDSRVFNAFKSIYLQDYSVYAPVK